MISVNITFSNLLLSSGKNFSNNSNKIVSLLVPTNTGQTHVAIAKMLEFASGLFGLPLSLLSREVFYKCIAKVVAETVALIT